MDQTTDRASAVFPAPRVLDGEIVQAQTPAPVVQLTPDQFSALLACVDRPVIVREAAASPAAYASRPGRGTGHPGINVTIPSAPAGFTLPDVWDKLPEVTTPREWAPLAFIASAGAFLSGPLVGIFVGSDAGAALLCFIGFAGGVVTLARLLRTD